MKNFKQLAFGLIVGASAIGFSAFTNAKRVDSNFFVYTSSSHTQTAIQTASNYQSTTLSPCGGTTTNVCGVTLPTAEPAGQNPDAGELASEAANLWTSQQNHTPADGDIAMKP